MTHQIIVLELDRFLQFENTAVEACSEHKHEVLHRQASPAAKGLHSLPEKLGIHIYATTFPSN